MSKVELANIIPYTLKNLSFGGNLFGQNKFQIRQGMATGIIDEMID